MPTPPLSPATIDDVARRAGVSISTVSRVINRTVPVSPDIVRRVEEAMRVLRYVPRAAARNLARRNTNTLGLLLPDGLGDFFGPLLRGIQNVTHEQGYDLLIATAGRPDPEDDLPHSLGNHNTDGLLIFAGCLRRQGLIRAYAQGVPMALIHQTPPPEVAIPCVTIENKAASRALVEHLIQVHERRRIVLLQGLPDNEDAQWREAGYREALAQHHIPFDPALVVPGDFDRQRACDSVARLLADGVIFEAVFSGDDEAAVGVYQALRAAGKRIPQDVAVVGFDDQRLAEVMTPALTTVHAPTAEVGAEATRQLLRLIKTGQAEPLTLLPTEVIIRQSCGCA
jgi:DNA-binding LacI/PurR family transcriptional regulator